MSVSTRPGATTLTWMLVRPLLLGQRERQRLHRGLAHVVGRAVGAHVRRWRPTRSSRCRPAPLGGRARSDGSAQAAEVVRAERMGGDHAHASPPGSVSATDRPRDAMPALHTSTSMPPKSATTACTIAAHWSGSSTDAGVGLRRRRRRAVIAATVSAAASASLAVVHGHRGALRREQFADAAADAPTATGHQHDTSVEFAHAPILTDRRAISSRRTAPLRLGSVTPCRTAAAKRSSPRSSPTSASPSPSSSASSSPARPACWPRPATAWPTPATRVC